MTGAGSGCDEVMTGTERCDEVLGARCGEVRGGVRRCGEMLTSVVR